jgi:hypothetical protein
MKTLLATSKFAVYESDNYRYIIEFDELGRKSGWCQMWLNDVLILLQEYHENFPTGRSFMYNLNGELISSGLVIEGSLYIHDNRAWSGLI